MTKYSSRLKALLCIMLAAAMLACPFDAAAANRSDDDGGISPQLVIIKSTNSSLVFSGVKAYCTASMTTSTSTSMSITMELQKKSSDTYNTVETWYKSGTGTSLSDSQSKVINILSDYRLKVTFKAGSETSVVFEY